MSKKRILWVSDSPGAPTGNGKITRNFIKHVGEHYDIACLGRGYMGWPGEAEKYGCTIYPMNIGKPYPDLMKEIGRQFRPQAVISCLDMWQIDWIEYAKQSEAVTNIGYISIYGIPVPYQWKKVVKGLDYAICYSEFGRKVLTEFMPFASLDMIHLGVDTDVFRPLNDKDKLKKKFKLEGKFVIGCIARNQIRKRLDKLIEGFIKFAETHPDAHLYLKTEKSTDHGYMLPELLEDYGITEKVTLAEHKKQNGFSEESLVEILNMFDVYVQTAGAEGFGMPILEAMACGTPVVAPDYSAMSELVRDVGIPLTPCFHRVVDMASVEQVSINTDELAGVLNNLYDNPDLRKSLGEKGRDYSLNFTWDRFGERWLDILSRVRWE